MSDTPTNPHIAAIVVNDGTAHAKAVVDGLVQQSLPLQAIAVINTGKGTIKSDTVNGVDITAFTAPPNAGYAQTVNPVLRQWAGRYKAIWLIDGRPDPYALKQLWPLASAGNLACATVALNTSLMTRAYHIDRLNGRLVPLGFTDLEKAEVLSRHGTLIPTTVFKAIGLLDERLHKYWEMADFSLRAKAAGFGLQVHNRAKVTIAQPAVIQNASDIFYLVRNRWWVVSPLQTLWQQAFMMCWDGWVWLGLLSKWAWARVTNDKNHAFLYEKTRLYWWGVYQGVHPFPPQIK